MFHSQCCDGNKILSKHENVTFLGMINIRELFFKLETNMRVYHSQMIIPENNLTYIETNAP